VIIVTMADDQRIHLADIDLQKCEVVRIDIRRETEIEEVAALFLAFA
jgi:hypothetical protein